MKNHELDLAWVKWRAADLKREARGALDYKKEVNTAIKKVPASQRTFENTVVALEHGKDLLQPVLQKIEVLVNAHPDAKLRAVGQGVIEKLQRDYIDLNFDEGVYQALTEYAALKPSLSGADKKLFKETLRDFKRIGFGLSRIQRNEIKTKLKKLSALSLKFRKNINDYQDHILVSHDELAGLPESYIDGLQKEGSNFRVNLDYPDYVPFMENAHNENKRHELARKYLRTGGDKNIQILKQILRLRRDLAIDLGYSSHAAFVLEVKMAKRPATVLRFIRGLMKPLSPKVTVELKQLEDYKRKVTNNSKAIISFSDIAYLINQTKRASFQVDEESLREYFPLKQVTKGMLQIYSQLFSIKFRQLNKIKTWHPDVFVYEVSDQKRVIGHFLLDLYPRSGKYGHAAVFPTIPGQQKTNGQYQKPLVVMMANFPKPMPRRPSLLSHREVETYFHEFGHVVHGLLTTAKFASQSGTQVQYDFVEAPSQMLENRTWDTAMLKLISGHYKNPRRKLPQQMLLQMVKAKNHMVAYTTMRQFIFGLFDMQLHTSRSIPDPRKVYAFLVKKHVNLDLPTDQMFAAGFGHLMEYDAGYYGYMWSKVYAADMFTRFQKEGLLNPKTGLDYRKFILGPGSSEEAINLVKKFLKREPNNRAFLKEVGL